MESRQHSSAPLSHQHDFPSLVSWPHHWHPKSFEITRARHPASPPSFRQRMTQVVPEHVARAKLTGASEPRSRRNVRSSKSEATRPQRSNSATLSSISVTCDTDTSTRSRPSRREPLPSSRPTAKNPIAASGLVHSPPTSFHTHPYKSGMNLRHEKSTISSSASTLSMPNAHSSLSASAGTLSAGSRPTRTLSLRHKAGSFEDRRQRASQSRGIGISVLEHLVFVFPDNIRRILTGPKK